MSVVRSLILLLLLFFLRRHEVSLLASPPTEDAIIFDQYPVLYEGYPCDPPVKRGDVSVCPLPSDMSSTTSFWREKLMRYVASPGWFDEVMFKAKEGPLGLYKRTLGGCWTNEVSYSMVNSSH